MINFGQTINIWMESFDTSPTTPPEDQNALIQENGFYLTQEDGSLILLES